jgi:hypothetical protein
MLIIRRTILFIRNFCWGLLIMITLILGSSCSQSPAVTYSIDEQYDLSHARSLICKISYSSLSNWSVTKSLLVRTSSSSPHSPIHWINLSYLESQGNRAS